MRPASVYVGGLSEDIQKEDLEREFGKYGTLTKVWVARNPPGFAFIEFEDDQDASEAIKEMNGATINGSEIRVDLSRGRGGRRGGRGGGGGGGGFRGGRDGGYSRGGGRGGYDSGFRWWWWWRLPWWTWRWWISLWWRQRKQLRQTFLRRWWRLQELKLQKSLPHGSEKRWRLVTRISLIFNCHRRTSTARMGANHLLPVYAVNSLQTMCHIFSF
ncbi:hypothetical protein TNIN_447511 [Trichonephila inaurata madagascariensis]|uniref:RRM domain-containing protein n=1 Tax=Trichonephila inaurata madagascariensis TaxID=2747483 RepID=A0A8X6MLK4_9ARAC|nr:hypothetical protein TNIN_447511 [Trichonephila inaurata madagascariensis]